MAFLMSFFLFTPVARALLGTLTTFFSTSHSVYLRTIESIVFWCWHLSSFSKKSNIKRSSKDKKGCFKNVEEQITSRANNAASKKSNRPNHPTFKKCTWPYILLAKLSTRPNNPQFRLFPYTSNLKVNLLLV